MARHPRFAYAWWHSDGGVLPSGATPAWALVGAAPVLQSDGVRMATTGAGAQYYAFESVKGIKKENLYFQAQVKGISSAPSWASGASGIGLYLHDGQSGLLLSIGATLRLVNMVTGAILWTAENPNPWLTGAIYRFRLENPSAWLVEVDGKSVGTVPYMLAPLSSSKVVTFGFGIFDAGGTESAVFEQVEVGQQAAVPRQWLVEKVFGADMPLKLQESWTATARGMLRSTVGAFEDLYQLLEGVWWEHTSRGLPVEEYSFTGERLASAEFPAWTLQNAARQSIIRERIRMRPNGGLVVSDVASFTALAITTQAERRARTTVLVQEYSPDAQGRVGPAIWVDTGHRVVAAELIETTAGSAWAWVLTDGAGAGALVEIGQRWPINPYREHTVEIRVFGRVWVLLLVDGRIVDRVSYSDFGGGILDAIVIGCVAGPTATVDFSHGYAARWLHDLTSRPDLRQRTIERIIPLAGCERNDEVECWKRHCSGVHAMRGTTRGLEVELARLSCGEHSAVVADGSLGSWYLEDSWPEVSPIFLELDGYLWDIYAEFSIGAPNWTYQALGEWIAVYMLPKSVVELTYYACLSAETLGIPVLVGGHHRVQVVSSSGFAAGDAVTLRNAANTVKEDTEVASIVSAVLIDLEPLSNPLVGYPAGSILRKVITSS